MTDIPQPTSNRRSVIIGIVAVVVVLLMVGTGIAFKKMNPVPTGEVQVPSVSLGIQAEIIPANLPLLNTTGTNPAGKDTVLFEAAAKEGTGWTDVHNSLSADEVLKRVQEKLGLKSLDTDNDQLSDLAEVLIYGTNPFYHDSDFDGQLDGLEVAAGTSPTGADSNEETKTLIAERKDYWKTDFALTAEQKEQSTRDFKRVAEAGKITVMLVLYYQQEGKYPIATTWTAARDELVKSKIIDSFIEPNVAPSYNDPLNQSAFVYEYTSSGTDYTFAYNLEGARVHLSQQGVQGLPGTVTETPLSKAVSVAPHTLFEKFIPTALAQVQLGTFFGTASTKDGVSVDVYGGQEWLSMVQNLYFTPTIVGGRQSGQNVLSASFVQIFGAAAQHGGGYCDAGGCYCSNGVTLAFGKNDAACGWAAVPATITAGQSFEAQIAMFNNGERFWNSGGVPYKLNLQQSNWGASSVNLPQSPIMAGQSTTFKFNVTAPTTPGSYLLSGKMNRQGSSDFGQACGNYVTVTAPVSTPTPTPTPTTIATAAPQNHNTCPWVAVPPTLTTGQTFSGSAGIFNNGGTTWTNPTYKLGFVKEGTSANPQDDPTFGIARQNIPKSPMKPGDSATINFTGIAPTTPGSYSIAPRMLQQGVEWFNQACAVSKVVVTAPPITVAPKNDALCSSWFNAPVSVTPGQKFNVSFGLYNSGQTIWKKEDGYKLGSQNPQDDSKWAVSRQDLPQTVNPGQSTFVTLTATAPNTIGIHSMAFQMLQEGKAWFGEKCLANTLGYMVVVAPSTTGTSTPTATPRPTATVTPQATGSSTPTTSPTFNPGDFKEKD